MASKDNVTQAEAAALAHRLEELRKSYDRYFVGVDRLEPQGDRRRFQGELDRMLASPSPNTQVRFQIAQIKGKYLTLVQYWSRVLREIEDGTYQRDRFRADLKEKQHAETTKARAKTEPAGAAAVDGEVVDRVLRAYLVAKQKCNEPTDGVSREKLAEMLARHSAKLAESSGGGRPDFKVIIKDGKARIVAKGVSDSKTDLANKPG